MRAPATAPIDGIQKIKYAIDEKEKVELEMAEKLNKMEEDVDIYTNKKREEVVYTYNNRLRDYNAQYDPYVSSQYNEQKKRKEIENKLVMQKAALSKKGAGWEVYQHLIDFDN